MNVLVINAGSTSLKYDVYDMDIEASLARGRIERMGTAAAVHVRAGKETPVAALDVSAALRVVADVLAGLKIDAIGHRVVHGGERLIAPTLVDIAAEAIIEECAVFAPLHNPANLLGIRAAREAFGDIPHVAVFDTAFHAGMPEDSYVYGLPYELYLERGIRRYGFHGPSHQFMAQSAAEYLGTDLARLRLVTCHLGGGASIAAIEGGISIDTSMGMTPLEGLVMGTRCGDLDPSVPLAMIRQGVSVLEVEQLLNKQSGLAGISGIGADFRDVQAAAERGEVRARLAVDIFVRRIRKYIGAYAAELGGIDAIVFTGGIGENSAMVRERVCERMNFLGVDLDPEANRTRRPAEAGGIVDVATRHAGARVLVVTTDEERMIARDVVRRLVGPTAAMRSVHSKPIPVGVSVRHVHLSRADCDALFGAGYELSRRRDVTQPGQFVTRETVDLIGPKGEIRSVAIINPLRKATQIEVSRTDALQLGVDPPLRESGQLHGTPGLKLRGPAGDVTIGSGVIMAMRHVHMHPTEARAFGVGDKDVIRIRAEGDRELTMGDVLVRVNDAFTLDLHLDTDEANAAGLSNSSVVAFDGIQKRA
ncbi:MAG: acetate/propionate family kinase [Deltaproteobacteria bacterium]|nr:acetate/propionate family kinase [Deltaproteobacteria bacterium]